MAPAPAAAAAAASTMTAIKRAGVVFYDFFLFVFCIIAFQLKFETTTT